MHTLDKTSPSTCESSTLKEVILPTVLVPVTLIILSCTLAIVVALRIKDSKNKRRKMIDRQISLSIPELLSLVKEKMGDAPCDEVVIEFMRLVRSSLQTYVSIGGHQRETNYFSYRSMHSIDGPTDSPSDGHCSHDAYTFLNGTVRIGSGTTSDKCGMEQNLAREYAEVLKLINEYGRRDPNIHSFMINETSV